jgi:hypothetical protein
MKTLKSAQSAKFKSLLKTSFLLSVAGFSVLLTGCASITGSSGQALTVGTMSKDKELLTCVECTLTNDKGSWKVKTPATVTVQKSGADLVVACEKVGHQPGTVRAISKAGAGMWGNIIFGGGVGAIIDHSKGTAYKYPEEITVVMGEANTLPQPKSKASKAKEEQKAAASANNKATDKAAGTDNKAASADNKDNVDSKAKAKS